MIKLPSLKKGSVSDFNPEDSSILEQQKEVFYQSQI
jgi:hypothetical protein